jgi:hypothetical protein
MKMATGDDLELGATNSANNITHLATNVSHAVGFLVTNSGNGGTTSPVIGIDGESDEIGVRGVGGTGVVGETFQGIGARGTATGGTGVLGEAKAGIGVEGKSTGSNPGVRGFSPSVGVQGESTRGWGVFGKGPKRPVGLVGGFGVVGSAHIGVMGVGHNEGIGVAGSADKIGVYGSTTSKSGLAGFFDGDVFILGNLTKMGIGSCVAVPFRDGSLRRLYSMESPESWFEDFGEKRLVKGKAEVTVDPGYASVVRGEYHIFITPYGDSNGLYVSRRTRTRFVVREQKGGKSTLTFSYRLVAKRKDIAGPRLQKVTPPAKRPITQAVVKKTGEKN